MMKNLGLVLLVVGVAVSAAFGAQLAPSMRTQVIAAHQSTADGEAAEITAVPGPEQRLTEWASNSGAPFFVGLFLVVLGSVLGRIGVKREMVVSSDADKDEEGARDFAEVLHELSKHVISLSQRMADVESASPTDLERFKEEIQNLQQSHIEPLVDSRAQVQVRYGMTTFAEVFGPMSAAERQLNRTWSALTDQHWPEALASIARAVRSMEQATEVKLTSLEA